MQTGATDSVSPSRVASADAAAELNTISKECCRLHNSLEGQYALRATLLAAGIKEVPQVGDTLGAFISAVYNAKLPIVALQDTPSSTRNV